MSKAKKWIMVDVDALESMPSGRRACDPALRWFSTTFPNGATLGQAWDACPNDLWRIWFALHSASSPALVAFASDCADRAATYADKAAYAANATAAAAICADKAAAYAAEATAAAAYTDAYATNADADRAATYAYATARAARAAATHAARVTATHAADRATTERDAQVAWAHDQLFNI